MIALDCRGHGESAKPYDSSIYGDALYEDVIRLMDHLGVEKADLFGYSMGGRITLALITRHADRFGENDNIVGSAKPMAKAIPGAKLVTVPDRDHLTVVGDQRFKDAVVAFLNEALVTVRPAPARRSRRSS